MSTTKDKKLTEFKQSRTEQLQLFELDPALSNYSHSIELYDSMPKYYFGGVERDKGRHVDALPVLQRDFVNRNKSYKLNISPAAVLDKNGKTIHYYPSQREELVEDVIKKIATKPNRATFFDKEVGVKFTYYEVMQELKKIGHGYSLDEVKLAIDILNKSILETISKDGNEVSMSSTFFTFVGKETKEMGGKERVVVVFHPLVTRSINFQTYRLLNYEKVMKLKMPLARWLYKRISHLFSQASINNPYRIKLSTIVRDSGMKSYKTISERRRQVEKALDELKKHKVIMSWGLDLDKEKNKILEVVYSLLMSEEFVADAKKANKLTNLRLGNNGDEKEIFDIEALRKEIENPIYGYTKTMINNCLEKIHTKEEYEIITKALEAAKEYINDLKRKDNKQPINRAAITKAAIAGGWVPKEEEPAEELLLVKQEKSPEEIEKDQKEKEHKIKAQELLQENPIWLEIREKIKTEFGDENWEKWFSDLKLFVLSESEVVLSATSKFIRDWVIREFLENVTLSKTDKTLKQIIRNVVPSIHKVGVICIEREITHQSSSLKTE